MMSSFSSGRGGKRRMNQFVMEENRRRSRCCREIVTASESAELLCAESEMGLAPHWWPSSMGEWSGSARLFEAVRGFMKGHLQEQPPHLQVAILDLQRWRHRDHNWDAQANHSRRVREIYIISAHHSSHVSMLFNKSTGRSAKRNAHYAVCTLFTALFV